MSDNILYPNGKIKAKFLKNLNGDCECNYPSEKYIIKGGKVYVKVDTFGNN